MTFQPTSERGRRALDIATSAGVELVSWAAQTAAARPNPRAVRRARAAGFKTPAARTTVAHDRLVTIFEIRTADGRPSLYWRTSRDQLDEQPDTLIADLRCVRWLEDRISHLPDHARLVRDGREALVRCDAARVRMVLGNAIGVLSDAEVRRLKTAGLPMHAALRLLRCGVIDIDGICELAPGLRRLAASLELPTVCDLIDTVVELTRSGIDPDRVEQAIVAGLSASP